jgi:hypothetical protein
VKEFTAHDHSHPQSTEIYAELGRLSKESMKHGHEFDRASIAFNTIQTPRPTTFVTASCVDVDHATKLIANAKIHRCDIVVRDANRTHHCYQMVDALVKTISNVG